MKKQLQQIATLVSGILRSHQRLQDDVEGLQESVRGMAGDIEALRRGYVSMQPRYHTLLHSFRSVSEAEFAWVLLNMTLYPKKHPTHETVAPMPMSRAFVAPWDEGEPDLTPPDTPSPIELKYHGEI